MIIGELDREYLFVPRFYSFIMKKVIRMNESPLPCSMHELAQTFKRCKEKAKISKEVPKWIWRCYPLYTVESF